MASLGEMAFKIRSKNAGPFWITIDIFFDQLEIYEKVKKILIIKFLSECLRIPRDSLKLFQIDNLKVLKISIQRPVIQGSILDRDLHGAQIANLFSELKIT